MYSIIFDIGKVLVDYDWEKLMEKLFDNDKAKIRRISDAMFNHGIWDEIDREVLSMDQIIDEFCKYEPDLRKDFYTFMENSGKALVQFPFTKDWLKELKSKGYKLYYCSNYSQYMIDRNPECLDFVPLMDGGIFSGHVHLIKPDAAIFNELFRRYNLNPAECVFLDDKPENIEGARKTGLNVIQVLNHQQAVRDLNAFLEA